MPSLLRASAALGLVCAAAGVAVRDEQALLAAKVKGVSADALKILATLPAKVQQALSPGIRSKLPNDAGASTLREFAPPELLFNNTGHCRVCDSAHDCGCLRKIAPSECDASSIKSFWNDILFKGFDPANENNHISLSCDGTYGINNHHTHCQSTWGACGTEVMDMNGNGNCDIGLWNLDAIVYEKVACPKTCSTKDEAASPWGAKVAEMLPVLPPKMEKHLPSAKLACDQCGGYCNRYCHCHAVGDGAGLFEWQCSKQNASLPDDVISCAMAAFGTP